MWLFLAVPPTVLQISYKTAQPNIIFNDCFLMHNLTNVLITVEVRLDVSECERFRPQLSCFSLYLILYVDINCRRRRLDLILIR